MKILVTGSSGTIGTRLCERLIQDGHDVLGVDWVKNKWQPSIDQLTFQADLRDDASIEAVGNDMKKRFKAPADALVHLAANARVYELVEHPERARDNFLTLFNALEIARQHGIKRFIFASSREAYGNIDPSRMQTGTQANQHARNFTEDLVRVENCESPYTASKVGGEAMVEAYARCYALDRITIRFSNVYGMYDDSIRVVPLFIRLAAKNEAMTIFGKDKCLDFTYIDDAVDGVTLMLAKFEQAKNDTYNLAYGEGRSILELAELIKKLKGSSSEITLGKPRTGEVIRYVADISKAKNVLGFDPKVRFDEGVAKAVEWYGNVKDNY